VTLNYLDAICDFFEKTKNLIKWEEPRLTKYFLLFSIVLFIFVTFLPIRTIIIIFLTHKFYRGRTWHMRRVRNNQEVCLIEFNNFLEDNKQKFANFDDKWEALLGKNANIKTYE
jgi:hypothetical protein